MSDWIKTPLEQLAEISSGGTPSRNNDQFWNGDIPWVTPSDITACKTNFLYDTQDLITHKGLLSSSAKLLEAGTLLFTSRATIGEVKIAERPVSTNQGFKSLTPRDGIDTDFLFYQIIRLRQEFIRYAAGSTFLEINRKDTGRVLISHPVNKDEQAKIGYILKTIDRAIAHTEALIEKYQQIKAGLMHDLFTRGIGADGKLRPPRDEAPELYQESAIGWIPREWNVLQLRDCLIDNPTNGIYKSQDQIGQGTLMIGQTAFTEERSVNFSLCRRGVISEAEKQHYYVAENNILITRVFATVDGVGLPTLVPQIHEEAVFESNMMRLRVDETKISPLILFEWLRNHRLRRLIVSGANASNQVSINQKTLNVLPIPLPSNDEQMRIANTIIASDSKHFTEKANLRKLVQKKSGLMHDLLTGKVPVKVDSDEVDHISN